MYEELTTSQIAELLKQKNVNVIPLQPKSKIPFDSWKVYQKEKYKGTIPNGQNYACVCGEISENLVVIDIDKTNDESIIDKILPNAKLNTLVVKTGSGGYHIFIRVMKLPNSAKLDYNGIHIDVQANGKYVVGAGSIHPNGKRYEIISDTIDIDYGDFQKIINNFEKLGFKIHQQQESAGLLAAGGIKQGNRHSSAIAYANHMLFKVGVTYETLLFEMGRWNESNNPPMDKAELERVCEDCYKYFQRKNAENVKNATGKDPKDKDIDDWCDEIMLEIQFKTLRDTDELLYYKDGLYHYDPIHFTIKTECQKIIPKCTDRIVSEIIKNIKRRTYVSRDEFDKDDNIINLKNGLYNIELNELTKHTPSFLSLRQLPIIYEPNAVAFDFIKFMKECLPLPSELYLMLEGFAYCLLPNNKFEKAFMLIGQGANGKSTFLSVMKNVFGAQNTSSESLHSLTNDKFAKASLFGKLANIHPDIESADLTDTGILKALISGDSLSAEKKYMPSFQFENKAKMFFSANRFPESSDQSSAFFRRFIIVDWQVSFLGREDVTLKERIIKNPTEISGIFNILISMLRQLKLRGYFRNEKSIDQLRKLWNEKANPIRKFVDDYIHFGHDYYLAKDLAYEEYTKFCLQNNVIKENKIIFGRTLRKLYSLGDSSKKIDGVPTHVYTGCCLRKQLRNVDDSTNERQTSL